MLGWLRKRDDPDGVAQWMYDPANGKGAIDTRWYEHSGTATQCRATPGFKETLAYKTQSPLCSSTTVLNVGTVATAYGCSSEVSDEAARRKLSTLNQIVED